MLSLNYLSSGDSQHILAILQTDFYDIIFGNLSSSNSHIQLYSLTIIHNCNSVYNYNIAIKLIENGLIDKIIKILENSGENIKIYLILLDIFESIFQLGSYEISPEDDSILILKDSNPYLEDFERLGGIEILTKMQSIKNLDVNLRLQQIIKKYFESE